MNPLDFLNIGLKLLDRVIPDPAQKAAAQLELMKQKQSGDLAQMDADVKLALAQVEVDKTEAQMTGFKGGWRPMCGYVCVTGLGYQFLVQPLLSWASGIAHWPVPPTLDVSSLMTLLFGMLGLGALRTKEKLADSD